MQNKTRSSRRTLVPVMGLTLAALLGPSTLASAGVGSGEPVSGSGGSGEPSSGSGGRGYIVSGTGSGSDEALQAIWGEAAVEHLLNRAGFGARSEEIRDWAQRAPLELVQFLLEEREQPEPFFYAPLRVDKDTLKDLEPEARRREISRMRARDRRQLASFTHWWIDEMVRAEDPLRERMTLFWHGLLTSASSTVKRSSALIRQNEFLRANALGNYGELLHGILRDAAMLEYLDNDSNRKGDPNENLAREVMELFSLGEGNYTEADIQEAARALTGRGRDYLGDYIFSPRKHDFGKKTIFGVEGRHDGDDLADILLAQEACPRYIAGRILVYMEGVPPSEQRLAHYAGLLREYDYELRPVLERLFLDPDFYADNVRAARVQGPIDFLVGSSRRLGIEPPAMFIAGASSQLGQKLLDPPNVKGWEGGVAWISTSTLMLRGNFAGMLLGVVEPEDLKLDALMALDDPIAMAAEMGDETMMDARMDASMDQAGPRNARKQSKSEFSKMAEQVSRFGYQPRINLTVRLQRRGVRTDAQIVAHLLADLLAIEAPDETHTMLIEYIADERHARSIRAVRLLDAGAESERLLRQLAHLILSLPEAQLG
jgi:uncharacterized protein (DUF1800 family)